MSFIFATHALFRLAAYVHTVFLCLQMADLLLPNLLTGNCSDRVCVRVSRFWNFYDTNNETKLLHADMVLIDEEVSTSDLLLNLPLQPLLSVVNQ